MYQRTAPHPAFRLCFALLGAIAGAAGCANLPPVQRPLPPVTAPAPTGATLSSANASTTTTRELAGDAPGGASSASWASAGSSSPQPAASSATSGLSSQTKGAAPSPASRYVTASDWEQPSSSETIRGQDTGYATPAYYSEPYTNESLPGAGDHPRHPMTASDASQVSQVQYLQPDPSLAPQPVGDVFQPVFPPVNPPSVLDASLPSADFDVYVQEGRTGRFMFGVGVNSEAGLTGQITVDERNFDLFRFPRSWDDIRYGRAFRGGGQGFRLEAVPGNQVQRYAVSFTEPYLLGSDVSLRVSGFLFDRGYQDWSEQRLGGRAALGYRLTPDLSISAALRAEEVTISNPRVLGVPQLDAVLGNNSLYSGRASLAHDTRDTPFAPTQGHYFEVAYEQVFGSFNYPRLDAEWQRHFLLRERPDTSGRHTLSFSTKLGFSGEDTPVFENYFAGGFSTLRGFNFRGASPRNMGVIVGGRFQAISSVEYMFPITQDDMIKGVAFVDYGTVQEKISVNWDDYRVAPGLGLRINIPALGPAPLALDFAIPVAHADGDRIQNFSFYFGFGRS